MSITGVRDCQPYGKASQGLVKVGLEQPLPQEGWGHSFRIWRHRFPKCQEQGWSWVLQCNFLDDHFACLAAKVLQKWPLVAVSCTAQCIHREFQAREISPISRSSYEARPYRQNKLNLKTTYVGWGVFFLSWIFTPHYCSPRPVPEAYSAGEKLFNFHSGLCQHCLVAISLLSIYPPRNHCSAPFPALCGPPSAGKAGEKEEIVTGSTGAMKLLVVVRCLGGGSPARTHTWNAAGRWGWGTGMSQGKHLSVLCVRAPYAWPPSHCSAKGVKDVPNACSYEEQ